MQQDPLEVYALVAAYGAHIDAGRHEEFAALFAPEGVLAVGAREVGGRAELAEFSRTAPGGIHTSGLPYLADPTATTPWVFVNSASGTILSGHYRDAFTRDRGGALLFARRDVDVEVRVDLPAG